MMAPVSTRRMSRRTSRPLPLHLRFTAGLAALLVGALTLLAASPALHFALHAEVAAGHTHDYGHPHHSHHGDGAEHAPEAPPLTAHEEDAGCVVQLFAQGAPVLDEPPQVLQPELISLFVPTAERALALARPDHLFPEGRAPPVVV